MAALLLAWASGVAAQAPALHVTLEAQLPEALQGCVSAERLQASYARVRESSSPYDAAVLSMAGDVDGDGSCDILTGHVGEGQGSAFPRPEVYLIPSSSLDPD